MRQKWGAAVEETLRALLAGTFLFRGAPEQALMFALSDGRCRRARAERGTVIYAPHRFRRCLAVVLAVHPLRMLVPTEAGMWHGTAAGAKAALDAVHINHTALFYCSALGAALSFVRKMLRV